MGRMSTEDTFQCPCCMFWKEDQDTQYFSSTCPCCGAESSQEDRMITMGQYIGYTDKIDRANANAKWIVCGFIVLIILPFAWFFIQFGVFFWLTITYIALFPVGILIAHLLDFCSSILKRIRQKYKNN